MIKSQITLKQLEAFVCVVDFGTFRKAAQILGTTQPNISARIAALEANLGVVLMHRDAGSVRLTEKGKELLASARQVLWSSEAFLETAERRDLIDDRLRLGVSELIACTWLHDFLRAFQNEYPSIAVELQVNLSREIEREHLAHQLDLALQTGPFSQEINSSELIGSYEYCWAATPEIADQFGASPKLADLFSQPILVHARHTAAPLALVAKTRALKLPEDRIVHSNSLASCLPMAVDGMGIALLPREMLLDPISQGLLREIACGWLPDPLEVYARYDADKVPRFVQQAAKLAYRVAGKHKQ